MMPQSLPRPRDAAAPSLVHRAMDAVNAHISDNRLRVGDTLPGEAHFATTLGVSRAVMREAFGALTALRLIDVGNGRRPRVGAIDGSVMGASLDHALATAQVSISEIWDVRRTLELRTAELAAHHRSDSEAGALVATADTMRQAGMAQDLQKLTALDIELHQLIARASGNTLFFQTIRSFEALMRVAVPVAWRTRVSETQRVSVLSQHCDLAHAIADRDAGAAVDLMSAHFHASIRDLLQDRAILPGA